MFRKGLVVAAICLMPAMAMAQGARGPFELTLSGTGSNGPNFNGFSAGHRPASGTSSPTTSRSPAVKR